MIEEEIRKKIQGRIATIEESLRYQLESMCELSSNIQVIRYLLYIINENK